MLALRIAALESIKIKEAKVIILVPIILVSSKILIRQKQMQRSQSS